MRIIAGTAKGRRLLVPRGREVRPSSDRVREALFSRLGDAVRSARALDLFAGTGALALEALSRGAAGAVLVESSRRALGILRRNVELAGFSDAARIVPGAAEAALRKLSSAGERFELVFLDPPWADRVALAAALAALTGRALLADGALVAVESRSGKRVESPQGLRTTWNRSYGGTELTVLRAEKEPSFPAQEEPRP
ncbi:MAG: 16S rRNA (guanine(966)-N(2))-methyltransferase RsmD [Polyangia bacterium]